jgi:hypothetical protein
MERTEDKINRCLSRKTLYIIRDLNDLNVSNEWIRRNYGISREYLRQLYRKFFHKGLIHRRHLVRDYSIAFPEIWIKGTELPGYDRYYNLINYAEKNIKGKKNKYYKKKTINNFMDERREYWEAKLAWEKYRVKAERKKDRERRRKSNSKNPSTLLPLDNDD